MKKITLKIPDKKLEAFMEMVQKLGLEISEEFAIPEEHISIVRERLDTAEDDDISWQEARKRFRYRDQK